MYFCRRLHWKPEPDTLARRRQKVRIGQRIPGQKVANFFTGLCIEVENIYFRSFVLKRSRIFFFWSRFSPVRDHEVKSLECSVTLLYMFEEARNYLDWQVRIPQAFYLQLPSRSITLRRTITLLGKPFPIT